MLAAAALGVYYFVKTHGVEPATNAPKKALSPSKKVARNKANKTNGVNTKKAKKTETKEELPTVPVRILYGTQTGTSKTMAENLERALFALHIAGFHFQTSVVNMKDYDQDNLEQESIVIVIMSTWTQGVPPQDARVFCDWVNDMALDFRVSKVWLEKVPHAVFGLGNAEYDEYYCTAAKNMERDLTELGSPSLVPIGFADDNVDQTKPFEQWRDTLIASMCEYVSEQYAASASPSTSSPSNGEKPKKQWLSQKEFRRQKKAKQAQIDEENGETVELNEEDYMNEKVLRQVSSRMMTKMTKTPRSRPVRTRTMASWTWRTLASR